MGFIKSCMGKCVVSSLQFKAFPSQDAYQVCICYFQIELEHRRELFLIEEVGRGKKTKPGWKAVAGFFYHCLRI